MPNRPVTNCATTGASVPASRRRLCPFQYIARRPRIAVEARPKKEGRDAESSDRSHWRVHDDVDRRSCTTGKAIVADGMILSMPRRCWARGEDWPLNNPKGKPGKKSVTFGSNSCMRLTPIQAEPAPAPPDAERRDIPAFAPLILTPRRGLNGRSLGRDITFTHLTDSEMSY